MDGPQRRKAVWRNPRWAASLVVAITLIVPTLASAGGASLLAQGKVGHDAWRITVGSDQGHKGICLEVVLDRSPSGRCSFPAERRGLVRSAVKWTRAGHPRLTIFAGAFNSKVHRVMSVGFDGERNELHFRKLLTAPTRKLQQFRYLTAVKKGPWCISELITESAEGDVLWAVPASDLLPYEPARVCR
jgi:hypothetical protein